MTQKIEWGAGTPGPWYVYPKYLSEVQTGDLKSVSSCWHEHAEGAEVMLEGVIDCSLEVSAANARAIAEVPAMVAMLREMIPANLCLTNANIPDDMNVPLDVPMGDLRRIAAILARIDATPA